MILIKDAFLLVWNILFKLIAEKFRRTPLQFQNEEQKYIEKPSAPVVLVRKTGELRYCIDYLVKNSDCSLV